MDIKIVLKAWQSENDRVVFQGDPDQTIRKMRRKQRGFFGLLLFSDFIEAGVSIAMAAIFIFHFAPMVGETRILIYVGAAALLGLAAFFIIDRIRQERQPRGTSLADEIRHYLLRVDRRIYLLRNVFWWYLLPGLVAWATLIGACFILTFEGWRKSPLSMAGSFGSAVLLALVIFVGVYKLNQSVVKRDLIPRKQELEQLLQDLTKEEG